MPFAMSRSRYSWNRSLQSGLKQCRIKTILQSKATGATVVKDLPPTENSLVGLASRGPERTRSAQI